MTLVHVDVELVHRWPHRFTEFLLPSENICIMKLPGIVIGLARLDLVYTRVTADKSMWPSNRLVLLLHVEQSFAV